MECFPCAKQVAFKPYFRASSVKDDNKNAVKISVIFVGKSFSVAIPNGESQLKSKTLLLFYSFEGHLLHLHCAKYSCRSFTNIKLLSLRATLGSKLYHHVHFTDETIEAQRNSATCPKK